MSILVLRTFAHPRGVGKKIVHKLKNIRTYSLRPTAKVLREKSSKCEVELFTKVLVIELDLQQ